MYLNRMRIHLMRIHLAVLSAYDTTSVATILVLSASKPWLCHVGGKPDTRFICNIVRYIA